MSLVMIDAAQLAAEAETAAGTIDPRELRTLAAAADMDLLRMTGAQYAGLVSIAVRAELRAKRAAGLYFDRATYLDIEAEMSAHVAVAGLERARAIDAETAHTWSRADRMIGDGFTPRWAGAYAEHRAPKGRRMAGIQWATLHRAERARLMRDRWIGELRHYAQQWLDARAQEYARSGDAAAMDAGTAATAQDRAAEAAAIVETLARALAAQGRPLAQLETYALIYAVSRLTHAEMAETYGTTAAASKTYAAKGRTALRRRWAGDARRMGADVRAVRRVRDRDDMRDAIGRLIADGRADGPAGDIARAMRRVERLAARSSAVRDILPNAELVRSGHAGGIVRTLDISAELRQLAPGMDGPATVDAGETRSASRIESIGRSHVGYAVHRAGIGSAEDRRARMLAAAHGYAQRAQLAAEAGEDETAHAMGRRAARMAAAARAIKAPAVRVPYAPIGTDAGATIDAETFAAHAQRETIRAQLAAARRPTIDAETLRTAETFPPAEWVDAERRPSIGGISAERRAEIRRELQSVSPKGTPIAGCKCEGCSAKRAARV